MKLIRRTVIFIAVMIFILPFTVHAENTSEDNYSVLIPKTIDLGNSDSTTFTIKTKGNLNDHDIVNVTADDSIAMSRVGDSSYSGTAIVDLNATWYGSDLNRDTYAGKQGTVTFNETKAGSYTGQLNFTIGYERSYNIIYETDGGTMPSNYQNYYYVNKGLSSLPTPTRTGYTFGGWYTASDLSGTAVTKIATGSTGNKTFYAKWTPINYTITYNLDGGTISGQATSYNIETATFTLPTPTKEGYRFTGWYLTNDFSDIKIQQIAKGSTGNKALYAKFDKEYKVTVLTNIYEDVELLADSYSAADKYTVYLNSKPNVWYGSNYGGTLSFGINSDNTSYYIKNSSSYVQKNYFNVEWSLSFKFSYSGNNNFYLKYPNKIDNSLYFEEIKAYLYAIIEGEDVTSLESNNKIITSSNTDYQYVYNSENYTNINLSYNITKFVGKPNAATNRGDLMYIRPNNVECFKLFNETYISGELLSPQSEIPGYVLEGYYEDDAYTIPVTNFNYNEDKVLYAKWKEA